MSPSARGPKPRPAAAARDALAGQLTERLATLGSALIAFSGGVDSSVAAALLQIFPTLHPIDMPISHPIFHSFFEVNNLDIIPQAYIAGQPIFRGLFVMSSMRSTPRSSRICAPMP